MEQIKKENTDTETEQKKLTPKQVFIIRMCFWVLFSLLIPVAFIIYRYDLFTTVSHIQFGGWGMLAVIILFTFVIVLGNYLKKGAKRYSLLLQVLSGILKITLPLVALYLILFNVKDSIDLFLQSLMVVIISETIAIPINPMPKWVADQNRGYMNDTIDYFFTQYDKRKDNENKGE